MKKMRFLLLAACLFAGLTAAWSQAKKPSLMVVPAENYCFQKGFMKTFDDQGTPVQVPDYERAFREDADLRSMINAINTYMAGREFPLKDMEQTVKSLGSIGIERELLKDKGGNSILLKPIDRYKQQAKADIILDLSFRFEKKGPERVLNVTLKGLDAYTNLQIAGDELVGKPSMTAPTITLLLEDNHTRMENFCTLLNAHFEDMMKNGRMVSLRFALADGAPIDFDKEYGDEEFSEILETWTAELAVGNRNGNIDLGDTELTVDQIRIPLMNPEKENQSLDARGFLQIFRKRLKKAPYNLSCKVRPRGLGEAWLIIGGADEAEEK